MINVKYAVPSDGELLAKYGQFYKTRAMNKVIEAIRPVTDSWALVGETLRIYSLNGREWRINENHHFAVIPVCKWESGQITEVSFRIDFEHNRYTPAFLDAAKEHVDPLMFIMDHRNHWSYDDKVVSFLGEPQHIGQPGVLDTIEDYIVADKFNCTTSTALAKAMGNALKNPELYEHARDIGLKHFGLGELAAYLHDPVVRKGFEKIVESAPDYYSRFVCLDYLDQMEKANAELEKTILVRMLAEVVGTNMGPSNYDDSMYMEDSLWFMSYAGYAALSSFGERKITTKLCAQLLAEDRTLVPIDLMGGAGSRGHTPLGGGSAAFTMGASLYSMLKFIALKTSDQEEFNLIVNTLVEFALTPDQKLRDLGVLQKLPDVLGELKAYNPKMLMPPLNVKISEEKRELDRLPKSAIPGVFARRTEYERWWKKYNNLLTEIINTPAFPEELRIAALRKCAVEMFPQGGWKHPSQHEQRGIATKAVLSLAGCPGKLGLEAERFKKWQDQFTEN